MMHICMHNFTIIRNNKSYIWYKSCLIVVTVIGTTLCHSVSGDHPLPLGLGRPPSATRSRQTIICPNHTYSDVLSMQSEKSLLLLASSLPLSLLATSRYGDDVVIFLFVPLPTLAGCFLFLFVPPADAPPFLLLSLSAAANPGSSNSQCPPCIAVNASSAGPRTSSSS